MNKGSQVRVQRPESVASRVEGCAEWVYSQAGRPHSLSQQRLARLFKERALFFFTMRLLILQRLQSICILHYNATLSPFVHTTHVFMTCTAGKKRAEEFGTKCILKRTGNESGSAWAERVRPKRVKAASGHFSLPVMPKCCRTLA